MKKLLVALALLLPSAVNAADNGVVFTPGSGGVARSKDVGVGVQLPGVFLSDQTGAFPGAFTTYGTSPGAVLVPSMNAFVTNSPVISGTVTANQGTAGGAAWLVTGTGGTFPVTGTVAISGTPTVRNTGNAGAIYDGVIGAATAPANMTVGGGVFNSAPLTLTNGQSAALQFDANGFLKVNTAAGAAAGGTSSNFGSAFPTPGTAIGVQSGANMIAWPAKAANTVAATDVVPEVAVANANPNGRATAANSAPAVLPAAPTTLHFIAAASTNANFAKASAAVVMSCQFSNNSTTPAYFKIFNKASAPTLGTDVPVVTAIIPGPAAGGGGSNIQFGPGGLALATGFAYAVTGVITDADATAVAATTFAINCQYD